MPVDYVHHDKGHVGDDVAFAQAQDRLHSTWPQWIRPQSAGERVVRETRERLAVQGGRMRHRLLSSLSRGPAPAEPR